MGLDSSLYKEQHFAGQCKVTVRNDKTFETLAENPTVVTEVAYWRKANQIHKWFVDNCADGKDTQERTYVYRGVLKQLLDICNQVKSTIHLVQKGEVKVFVGIDKEGKLIWEQRPYYVIEDPSTAKKLLPTQAGFFFGSTEYDESYAQDIDLTIEQLTEILKEPEDSDTDYYYEASW